MSTPPIDPALLSDDSVQGDPAREAVAALRGFAYQLYASALAWLSLGDGEDLYLEVAEDYAVACREALSGVQVRDTGASKLTIRSEGAIKGIDSLVDLQGRNPYRRVTIRYLTTSEIGIEKAVADRADSAGSLRYWRRAAAGGPVDPIRRVLERLPLAADTKTFIASCSDDELRSKLLGRIFWDTGQPEMAQLEADLTDGLTEFVRSSLRLPSDVAFSLRGRVLERLLRTAVSQSDRRLRVADLLKLAEQASMILVPRGSLAVLGGGLPATWTANLLQPGSSVGRLAGELDRPALVRAVTDMITRSSLAVITGSTGTGKTALARAAAGERGGLWDLADFRGLTSEQTLARLDGVIGEALAAGSRTLILDDLGHVGTSAVLPRLERLLTSLRRRDGALIITAALPPPPSGLDRLVDQAAAVVIEAPYFTREEVEALVSRQGGRPHHAAYVWLVAGQGHPQLTQAAIALLKRNGWAREGLSEAGPVAKGLAVERSSARKRLLDALPADSRALLYRASLIFGRFDRDAVLKIGKTPPPIPAAGEAFDLLVGPWIEEVSLGEYRVSPLVAKAGEDMLDEEERTSIHRTLASNFLMAGGISPTQADALLYHSMAGGDPRQVAGFATAVLTTSYDRLEDLARYSTYLLYLNTDQPGIGDPTANATLRLAQFLVTAAGGSKARTVKVWEALQRETTTVRDPALFELVILSKSLMVPGLSNKLPGWLAQLVRLIELDDTPTLSAVTASLQEQGFGGEMGSFFFLMQAAGLSRLQQLRDLFDELDQLAPEVRHLLVGASPRQGQEAYYVTAVWLKEVGASDFDPHRAARQFREMADMAAGWGEQVTALRCAVAATIMLDEYANDPAAARQLLDEMEARLGRHAIVQRARAKLWWRQQDHAEALKHFDQLALDEIGDPTEQAHAAREAAISAAELGRWDRAADYFKAGAAAADQERHEILSAMAAGLEADAGQACFRAGRLEEAIKLYAAALQRLAGIDPAATLQGAYAHRVIRHALLWLMLEVKNAHDEVAENIVLPPGACSNPSPSKEIKQLPLGDVGLAWYMLAQAELLLGLPADIDERLHELTPGGAIQSMEIQRTKLHIDDALRRLDAVKLASWLDRFLASYRAIRYRLDELLAADPMNMPRGSLVTVEAAQWSDDDVQSVRDLMISFAVTAAAEGRADAIATLAGHLQGKHPTIDALLSDFGGQSGAQSEADDWVREVLSAMLEGTLNPTANLRSLIQVVLFLRTSEFRAIVEAELAPVVRSRWQAVADTQRFALLMPGISVPALHACLEQYQPTSAWMARLSLAALGGVDVRLGEGVQARLLEVAGRP